MFNKKLKADVIKLETKVKTISYQMEILQKNHNGQIAALQSKISHLETQFAGLQKGFSTVGNKFEEFQNRQKEVVTAKKELPKPLLKKLKKILK